ncbi:MAG: C1 family peptidase [Planctomycetaceae bacterium]|nr:C1 family peptidase [Planctomycetaceae bacterium]
MARSRPGVTAGASVASIRSAIARKGATWEAGETSLTALSPAERVAHLGLRVSDEERTAARQAIKAANRISALSRAAAAPAAIDWRNNGGNFVTPIKDQANCGACVSFATLATIESRVNIACRTPSGARDYSEAFLFYCGCGKCCSSGWNFAPALDFCRETGVALDAAFPYTPGDQTCKSGVAVSFKINGHSTAASTADRKAALVRGPVVGGMAVYQDFYAYTRGVYRHVSGNLTGYHAVSVIGYDDADRCWICKNSWGSAWGDAGFFRVGYGDAEMDTEFLFYEPQVACPTPAPVVDCARYVPYLQRALETARSHSALRASLRYHVCGKGVRYNFSPDVLAVARVVVSILNRCPQYRASFCRILG